jgi:hypothetical protein
LLSVKSNCNIASTRFIEQWLQSSQGKFMQIATYNHDQPGPARFASATGAWFVLERMQGFRGLALGCPSVAAKA